MVKKDKWKMVRETKYHIYRISSDGLLKRPQNPTFSPHVGYLTQGEAEGAILVDARNQQTCAGPFVVLPIVKVRQELET